jgi:hypothetical protein
MEVGVTAVHPVSTKDCLGDSPLAEVVFGIPPVVPGN